MRGNESIQAVVFDWAGTLVDFGSLAPTTAFVELFEGQGVAISLEQARIPMGLPKRDHIVALARMPDVQRRWEQRFGKAFGDRDADHLLALFEPMSASAAVNRAELIPGVLETAEYLRSNSIRIGSTTGYTRTIMRGVVEAAARQGFLPDSVICTDEVPQGRPSPFAMYRSMLELAVWPAHTVVKVDDTRPGLAEGIAAGCWTVGVVASGNALGLDLHEYQSLSEGERHSALAAARIALDAAGAHELIESVAELPQALARIQDRIRAGERPAQ
jgi:phosphonoacetaldehyde hydrolase